MTNGLLAPVAAGLAIGVAFVFVLSVSTFARTVSSEFSIVDPGYYSPLIQLSITGLQERYFAGERIDFAVTQKFGGCVFPENVMVKNRETGSTIWQFNGTEANFMVFGCPAHANPTTSRMTMNTASEPPLIINQTGPYAVIAKLQFKTVETHFTVIDSGNDSTSPEVAVRLLSMSKHIDVVQALLETYPGAKTTVTANYNSELFKEYQKYDPDGIVQYSVDKTDSRIGDRVLLVTVISDIYYRLDTPPLIIVQCSGENYSSIYVSQLPVATSEIEKC